MNDHQTMKAEKILFRCKDCKEPMEQVVLPFRMSTCEADCFDAAHFHIRCKACSAAGAYFAVTINKQNQIVYA